MINHGDPLLKLTADANHLLALTSHLSMCKYFMYKQMKYSGDTTKRVLNKVNNLRCKSNFANKNDANQYLSPASILQNHDGESDDFGGVINSVVAKSPMHQNLQQMSMMKKSKFCKFEYLIKYFV